jgi:hypothetical protein
VWIRHVDLCNNQKRRFNSLLDKLTILQIHDPPNTRPLSFLMHSSDQLSPTVKNEASSGDHPFQCSNKHYPKKMNPPKKNWTREKSAPSLFLIMVDVGKQDFTTCLPDPPPSPTWDWPGHPAAPSKSFPYRTDFTRCQGLRKRWHLLPDTLGHGRKPHVRLATGTRVRIHPIAVWHSDSNKGTYIITTITLTSDKHALVRVSFSM